MTAPRPTGHGHAGWVQAQNWQAGFGLLEVLIVLMITGAMGLVMMSMLSQIRPLSEKQVQVENIQSLQAVVRHVARTIESAEMLVLAPQGEKAGGLYLDGEADSIRFAAVARRGVRTTGLAEIQFTVDRSGRKPRLVQLVKDKRERGDVQKIILADGIRSVKFGYAEGSATRSDPENWQNVWSTNAKLPSAIAVSVVQERNGSEPIALRAVAVPLAR
ncbi:hypothetical protein [Oricola cellulosilytica]|uniref:Type II secretion system protein J n=1 Tax=Oricola cellulosilytica TaxID=1429082 RepID=A0A4R0PFQ1_9HYPH|nr:hypothetical protein [Oricola cellulosilytica]TCD16666.1 hypothetical protein E0D97_04440 [Oricola cellulosilytica]